MIKRDFNEAFGEFRKQHNITIKHLTKLGKCSEVAFKSYFYHKIRRHDLNKDYGNGFMKGKRMIEVIEKHNLIWPDKQSCSVEEINAYDELFMRLLKEEGA